MEEGEKPSLVIHNRVFWEAGPLSYVCYPLYCACVYGFNEVLQKNNLDQIGIKSKSLNNIYFTFEILNSDVQFARFDVLEFYCREGDNIWRRTSFYVNLSVEKVLFITQGDYNQPYDEDRDKDEVNEGLKIRYMMTCDEGVDIDNPRPDDNVFTDDGFQRIAVPAETGGIYYCEIIIICRFFRIFLADLNKVQIVDYSRDKI